MRGKPDQTRVANPLQRIAENKKADYRKRLRASIGRPLRCPLICQEKHELAAGSVQRYLQLRQDRRPEFFRGFAPAQPNRTILDFRPPHVENVTETLIGADA